MDNHKAYINTLDEAYMLNLFNQETELVNPKGYGIFLNEQRIKPNRGNVDHYPTITAAIDALERNSKAYHDIKDKLFYDKYHFNWKVNKEEYYAYFYKPEKRGTGFKNEEVWNEHRTIEKAARNAMKHFVKQWMKSGVLEIKPI